MLAQTCQHGLVQKLANAIGIPVTQAPPAGHTTAVTQGMRQVPPWDAGLQHEQNAIERCFIAHGKLTCATFDGRREGRDQGCSCRHSSLLTGCLAMRARSINVSGCSQREVVLVALSTPPWRGGSDDLLELFLDRYIGASKVWIVTPTTMLSVKIKKIAILA